jgi:hypothetical protein
MSGICESQVNHFECNPDITTVVAEWLSEINAQRLILEHIRDLDSRFSFEVRRR